jgi:hypothetical protein
MAVYEIETDQGTYELELDRELDDSPESHQLLQRLLADQLSQQQAQQNTPASLATQALGGARDAVQRLVDIPANLANTIGEFISPDAPGGPRRRAVPEVSMPQLPNVSAPTTGLERGVRVGAELGTDVLATLALPGMKAKLARLLQSDAALRPPGLMFESGAAAAKGGLPGGPVKTLAVPSGPLLAELSKPAQNLASVLGLPTAMPAIRAMTLPEAQAAVQRLLASVGEHHHLTQQAGPVRDLFDVLQAQMLRYR